MKIIELEKDVFNDYSKNHEYGSFYQTTYYGDLMETTGYKAYYLGLTDDDDLLIGASLILVKKLYGNKKYAYAPRGFLVNYNDFLVLKLLTLHIQKYLRKRNVVFVKLDPAVINMERDESGEIITNGINNNSITNNLNKLGYIHMGYNRNFKTIKPRWNMVINNTGNFENSINKRIKTNIKNTERRGVEIYKGDSRDIKEFYDLIKSKHYRKLDYYENYYRIFKEKNMIDIYFLKINPIKYLENTRELLVEEEKKNEKLVYELQHTDKKDTVVLRKMASDKNVARLKKELVTAIHMTKTEPSGAIIATNAIIKHNNELFFLIDGINPKYKDLSPNHLLKYQIISEYIEKGYTKINLNGISGDFDEKSKYYGLYKFKKLFGSTVEEYIGEYNLVIKKQKYKLARIIFNILNIFKVERQQKNTF